MGPPFEVVVRKTLPVIRSTLFKDLFERYGLGQTKIAKKPGVTNLLETAGVRIKAIWQVILPVDMLGLQRRVRALPLKFSYLNRAR